MACSYTFPGQSGDEIPSKGYNHLQQLIQADTTFKITKKEKKKEDVLVKYSDHEFYPAYIVHYSGRFLYPDKKKM